ncbi:hypothetical protein [Streptomyces sp. LS1784]|uniref:hypothetical protein n=1 Tax=Streptomyces sp. LS1784 TaxID=2851533 RepID=UPI001CCE5769|nr:hypothetical protein [Streptomyces sp. LS1784]
MTADGVPARQAAGWGGLGPVLLAWTVFEAVKHTGATVPLAVVGFLVPFVAKLAPGNVPVRHLVLGPWVPLAVDAVCVAVPGPRRTPPHRSPSGRPG